MRPLLLDHPFLSAYISDLVATGDSVALRFAMDVMGKEPKAITPDEALLKEAEVLERLAIIYAKLGRPSGEAAPSAKIAKEVASADWAKLPLIDAIFECLRASKTPKTPKQIWTELESVGCEVASDTPIEAVHWALKKMAIKNTNVIPVGWGAWHLRSKYTKAQLRKLLVKRAGKGGRTRTEHAERTKAGMELAKAKGVRIGARIKATPAVVAEAKKMILDGMILREVAEKLNISANALFLHGVRPRIIRREAAELKAAAQSEKGAHVRLIASNE